MYPLPRNPVMTTHRFFAPCPRGVEPLLCDELRGLGIATVRPTTAGVAFDATLGRGYRACLWARTASRLLLLLDEGPCTGDESLYARVHALPWEQHLAPSGSLWIDFSGRSPWLRHTRFGAQRVKDAIVDRLRGRFGQRPRVEAETPELRIAAHLHLDTLSLYLDLAGESLHRRGYRERTVEAPLKEALAAALLMKAGWPASGEAALLDPMCGSGTLLLEGALMATDTAPGLRRERWGFDRWPGHDEAVWAELMAEARARHELGMQQVLPAFLGRDADRRAVNAARANARRAGFGALVRFEHGALQDCRPPTGITRGLVVTNPPYGERLGEPGALGALYGVLGEVLRTQFRGWRAAVFTANPELGKRMGIKALRTNVFYNGALPCRLLQFEIEPDRFVDHERLAARDRAQALERALQGGGEAFANRLRKNMRLLRRWAAREGVDCYRLYDADLPEFAVAVDRYGDWLHVQEYAPPAQVDPARARARLEQVMTLLPTVTGVDPTQVVLKVRSRQRGPDQYTRQGHGGHFIEVGEGPARLLVNLTDYLDTGLFPDHRITRALLREWAAGARFLNLFCYTAAATVHAALGGAHSTVSVDLSRTYLEWARRNLELNGVGGEDHRLVQADARAWLAADRGTYDLIFLDPPTFSNSKRMSGVLDIQRDHVALIRQAAARLAPGGRLVFSTNHRRFRLDAQALSDLSIEDISARTLPPDFARNPRVHRCWSIRH